MSNVRQIEFVQYGTTNIHPLVGVFMLIMSAVVLGGKRASVVFAVLAVCVLMPMEQRLVIAGIDLPMLRLMMFVAWLRVFLRGEFRGIRFGPLDRWFVFWIVSASLFHVLRSGPSAIVYELGSSFDAITAFFLFRALVRTRQQAFGVWRSLAVLVVVLMPFFVYEALAEHNLFGALEYSGFDEVEVRNGRVRAQGPFSHPILAGTFASVLVPVFFGIGFAGGRQKRLFVAATIAATTVTAASGSSGPAMAWAIGVVGWMLWRLREYTRVGIAAVLFVALLLHVVREKPVWHLIGRVSAITGGTGHHRYQLIDAFVRNFGDWALVGTDDTELWGWGLQDTTNYYVAQGVGGGLVTLVVFLVLLRCAFVSLRAARRAFERVGGRRDLWGLLAWGCSVSLAASCASFISVGYFGQMKQFFCFFLATVAVLAQYPGLIASRVRAESSRPPRASATVAPIARPSRPSAHRN